MNYQQVARMELVESGISAVAGHRVIIGFKNRNSKGKYELWQRRFWEYTLRDDFDFSRYMDYIHYNLVKPRYILKVKG